MKHRGIALTVVTLSVCSFAAGQSALAQSLSERLKREPAQRLAAAAREKGSAARGAILFTRPDVGCTKCHVSGRDDLLGPGLHQFGPEATDQYLVEALLEPSKVIRKGFESALVTTTDGRIFQGRIMKRSKTRLILRDLNPGKPQIKLAGEDIEEVVLSKTSSMPVNLVDQLKNRDEFLDLARYVMQLASTSRTRPLLAHTRGGGKVSPELRGLVLLKEFNCAACHKDDLPANLLTMKQAPVLSWAGGRIDPHYIETFLTNPFKVKPGTTMPDVMHRLAAEERAKAASELTHYIVSLQDRSFRRQPLDDEAAVRGRELFHTVGCVACHSPRDSSGQALLSDDSVSLGPLGRKYNRDGLVEFLKNPHAVRPSGRMPSLKLTHWEAVDISNYLLRSAAPVEEAGEAFKCDPALAANGKRRFDQLGCVRCHGNGTTENTALSRSLSRVQPERGCLAKEEGAWPQFDFRDEQREAIRAALARKRPLSDEHQIAMSLTAFRCLNCHQRGELGGVSDQRDPYFLTADPNLGPQGRIPPTLTDVGAKLNPKWLRQVLVSGRAIRPYVKTRMPQYGAENVGHLVALFARADHLPDAPHGTLTDLKEARKVGAELAGTGGLNCIACHTFQLKQAANMPAVDLTEMAERLHKNWFYHYMRDPQRFSMNTVMPSFWPSGRAARKDILAGDTDAQIEALWQYLLEGRQARPPRGLIREPIKLLATDEAVMLRRKYPGIGKRGIGVGYPEQVNIVFDAEQMRLGTIWKGKFADPGGVWRSQGHGNVRPLGHDLIQFPKGPELDAPDSPWVVDDGRPPNHQFKGYDLDEKQRPKFRYRFSDVAVQDYPVDVLDPATGQAFIRRTLTLKTSGVRRDALFRAAEGKNIRREEDGVFLIDGSLRIRIDATHQGEIVESPSGQQLRIPVRVSGNETTLTLEYSW